MVKDNSGEYDCMLGSLIRTASLMQYIKILLRIAINPLLSPLQLKLMYHNVLKYWDT